MYKQTVKYANVLGSYGCADGHTISKCTERHVCTDRQTYHPSTYLPNKSKSYDYLTCM